MNERDRLANFYAGLTDEELIQVGSQYESLTEDAKLLLREEFDKRSLDPPVLEELPDSFELQELVTIRNFRDPLDAMMAKSVLDSADIPCFLKDENTVRIQWLWSNLIGGIRLQVRPQDVEIAEQLLSQEVSPTIELEDGKVYEQPRCPYCTSLDISFEARNEQVGLAPILGLASLLVGVPIAFPKNRWACRTCGREWNNSASLGTPSDSK
jgi:Putative prokaryotic signal transducing protein